MNCAEIEILICDYVDGTLGPAERSEVERHLAGCAPCAVLARDAEAAIAFIGRAADVEPPPELVTRILFEAPWQKRKAGWLGRVFHSVLSPKFALSMAMTIISFSVMLRPVGHLKPSDLQPANVWADIEDRAYRAWSRTLKFYDNLKFVYQIQTTLREWQQDQEPQQPASDSDAPPNKPDDHRLPVKNNSGQSGAPAPKPAGGQ